MSNKICNNEYHVTLSVEITTKTNSKTATAADGSTDEKVNATNCSNSKSNNNESNKSSSNNGNGSSNDSCHKLTFLETFSRHALTLLGKLRTISNAES